MGDMTPDKGVFKRKGSDVWQHRVFIPADVRCHYGDKTELPAKSLGTRDLKEANRLARKRLAEYEQEFDEKRALASGLGATSATGPSASANRPPSMAQAERIVAQYRQELIDRDFRERGEALAKAEADPEAFWRCEILPRPQDVRYIGKAPYSYWDRLCEDGDTPLRVGVIYALHAQRKHRLRIVEDELRLGQTSRLEYEATALLAGLHCDEPTRRNLLRRMMQTESTALTQLINEQALEEPTLGQEHLGTVDESENPRLSIAATAWVKEKVMLKLTPRRIEECEAAIALFLEIVDDRPVGNYLKSDIRDFKDVLIALPPNRNKNTATRGLRAPDAAKKARALKLRPMTVKTANNKYIAPLRNFFDYAVGNYDAVAVNPFQNAALPERNSPRHEWDPFTEAALKVFFDAPLYRGCKSAQFWMEPGTVVPRNSPRFWLPLLLLYTGARVNEICKLRVKDIGQDQDIHYLSIEWEEEDDGPIEGRVKNASSHRRVPIHDHLIAFGFVAFVERVRKAKYERLFHELKPNKYGKLYGTISQRFSDTFLPKLGIKTPKTSLKSFRHNFVDAARNSRIPDEIVQALKGDSLPGTLARYGDGKTDLEILAEEMRKLSFKGLNLTHLIAGDERE